MTPELRSRIAHRTRASRLRSDLTGLTVLTGLVATAGFGWLAAATYAGTPQSSKAATTTRSDRSTVATPAPRDDESTTTSGSSSTRSNGSSSSGASVGGSSGVSRSSGRGHITSGSS
jgi:hypothetical protein